MTPPKLPLNYPKTTSQRTPISEEALTLSLKVDECKPLAMGLNVWACRQGFTLVHFSAQPEPFLIQEHTLHLP
jgi:hypothetical protein